MTSISSIKNSIEAVSSENLPATSTIAAQEQHDTPIKKTTWQKLFPVMACGAGLFSDGYINNVSDLEYSSEHSIYLAHARSLRILHAMFTIPKFSIAFEKFLTILRSSDQYQPFSPKSMGRSTQSQTLARTFLPLLSLAQSLDSYSSATQAINGLAPAHSWLPQLSLFSSPRLVLDHMDGRAVSKACSWL